MHFFFLERNCELIFWLSSRRRFRGRPEESVHGVLPEGAQKTIADLECCEKFVLVLSKKSWEMRLRAKPIFQKEGLPCIQILRCANWKRLRRSLLPYNNSSKMMPLLSSFIKIPSSI